MAHFSSTDPPWVHHVQNNSAEFGGALDVVDSNVCWPGEAYSCFEENKAQFGGALVLDSAQLTCTEKTITASTGSLATTRGGAIDMSGSSAVFGGDVWFDTSSATEELDNFESGFGGALVVARGTNVAWHRDLNFTGNSAENKAKDAGSPIYVSGTGFSPACTGISFISNSAQVGGAASIVASGNLKQERKSNRRIRRYSIGGFSSATGPQPQVALLKARLGRISPLTACSREIERGQGGALRLTGVSEDGEGAAVSNIVQFLGWHTSHSVATPSTVSRACSWFSR